MASTKQAEALTACAELLAELLRADLLSDEHADTAEALLAAAGVEA